MPHYRGDLLKSVPWSKSELFLVFRPSATQIVFFVRVLIPQWGKSGGASLFFLIGLENLVFQYWCHTLTFGFLGHKVTNIDKQFSSRSLIGVICKYKVIDTLLLKIGKVWPEISWKNMFCAVFQKNQMSVCDIFTKSCFTAYISDVWQGVIDFL